MGTNTKEADAIKAYEAEMIKSHVDFNLSQCGLVIDQEYPWIHATPDFHAVDWNVVK